MITYHHDFATEEERETEQRRVNELLLRYAKQGFSPHPGSVQRFINEGADVNFCDSDAAARLSFGTQTVLHVLASSGDVNCFREALQTFLPVRFNAADNTGRTVLHRIFERVDEEDAQVMLGSVLHRLRQREINGVSPWNPNDDVIDWSSRKPFGCDVISYIAALGLLSTLWPMLRALPAYSASPVPVSTVVWAWDWAACLKGDPGAAERLVLQHRRPCQESRSTASLLRLCCSTRLEGGDMVVLLRRLIVAERANLAFIAPFRSETLLHRLFAVGTVECAAVCLESPLPLDFAALDEFGRTPLHILCDGPDREEAAELLRRIVARVRSPEPPRAPEEVRTGLFEYKTEERCDACALFCAATDEASASPSHVDFISFAAAHQRLSAFWPVVRELVVAQLAERQTKRVLLTQSVHRCDWNELPEADRMRYFQDPFERTNKASPNR